MGSASEFGTARHLVSRFFGALWPGGPRPADEQWARRFLLPGEQSLWDRMSGPDRRHAVGVARGTIELLGGEDNDEARAVVASALLHDVGKVEARLGTVGRALVTMLAMGVGRPRLSVVPARGRPEAWWRRRSRLYLTHDRVGAALLEGAGSDPLTVTWAAEHHRDPADWSVDSRIATALKSADDD